MPESTLGVGIVGVSPVRGWAATAHIPALRALPSYEIRALSAHNADPARPAGELWGGCGVLRPRTASYSARRGRHHGQGPTPSRAHLRRTGRRQAVNSEGPVGRDLDDARAMAALAADERAPTSSGCRPAKPGRSSSFSCCSGRIRWRGLVNNHGGAVGPGRRRRPAQRLDARQDKRGQPAHDHDGEQPRHPQLRLGEFTDLSALSDLADHSSPSKRPGSRSRKGANQIAIIGTLTSGATASIQVREGVAGCLRSSKE